MKSFQELAVSHCRGHQAGQPLRIDNTKLWYVCSIGVYLTKPLHSCAQSSYQTQPQATSELEEQTKCTYLGRKRSISDPPSHLKEHYSTTSYQKFIRRLKEIISFKAALALHTHSFFFFLSITAPQSGKKMVIGVHVVTASQVQSIGCMWQAISSCS